MKFNTKSQKGFSLLELLLVVAVGAILILAGLAIYRNVTSQTQVNDASRLVNVLKQETQKLWQGETLYGGAAAADLVPTLVAANAVPNSYVVAGTPPTINSPFDTAVTVVSDTPATTFTITFNAVPQGACINLGTLYNANDPDFAGVTIGSTALTAPDVATVTTACTGGANMAWSFN